MKLNPAPFEKIKTCKKTVEMRLYDEKRRLIKAGDNIEFTSNVNGESLTVYVEAVRVFKDFAELYSEYKPYALGYLDNEDISPDDMYKYYSREDVAKYGVVAIEVHPCLHP